LAEGLKEKRNPSVAQLADAAAKALSRLWTAVLHSGDMDQTEALLDRLEAIEDEVRDIPEALEALRRPNGSATHS
jgi:hypothetical protein